MNNSSIFQRLKSIFKVITESKTFLKGIGNYFFDLKKNIFGLPKFMIMPEAVLIFDILLATLSFFLAIYLRIGDEFLDFSPDYILKNIAVFSLVSLSVFLWMQTHKPLWRYFSIEDTIPLALAVTVANIIYFPLMILLAQEQALPKSIPFLNIPLYLIILCLPRLAFRYIHEQRLTHKRKLILSHSIPIVVAGHSDAVELFIYEVMHSPILSYHIMGVISPNSKEKGTYIHSIPILGSFKDWKKILKKLGDENKKPTHVVIADNELSEEFIELIAKEAEESGISVLKLLPKFSVINK